MTVNRLNLNNDTPFYLRGLKAGDGASLKGDLESPKKEKNPYIREELASFFAPIDKPGLMFTEREDWVLPIENRRNYATWLYDSMFSVDGLEGSNEKFADDLKHQWLNLEEAFELDKTYIFNINEEVVEFKLKSESEMQENENAIALEMKVSPGEEDYANLFVDYPDPSGKLKFEIEKPIQTKNESKSVLTKQAVLLDLSEALLKELGRSYECGSPELVIENFVNNHKDKIFENAKPGETYSLEHHDNAVVLLVTELPDSSPTFSIQVDFADKKYCIEATKDEDNFVMINIIERVD